MVDVSDWMDDEEANEWMYATCDECGEENTGCECIACTECMEFGVGALTVDQNLTLCMPCAEELKVSLINITDAMRRILS